MLRLILPLVGLVSTSALADDWCHSRFETKDGYTISLDYQIHGRPNRAGTYTADPIWVNVSGPFAGQKDASIELTDIHAHGLTERNQVLALNLLPTDGSRFTVDGKLNTSSNNSQAIRVRIGSQWSETFAFNMGYALWDTHSTCRFD